MRKILATLLTLLPCAAFGAFLYQNIPGRIAPNLNSGTATARFECDSITAPNAPSGVVTYPDIIANPATAGLTISDTAVPGNVLSNMVAREGGYSTFLAANPGKTHNVFSAYCIVNNTTDPTYWPSGSALFLSDLAAILDTYRSLGADKIIVATTHHFAFDDSGTSGVWTNAINTGIRAMVAQGHADVVAEFGGDWMGYFGSSVNRLQTLDGLHPTGPRQQTVLAREWARAFNGLMAGSTTPGTTSGLQVAQSLQTAMYLQWDPPSAGGLYTNFELGYKLHADPNYTLWAHDAGSRQWTAVVTGLTAGASYDFRVRVTGPGGNGTYTTLTASTESLSAGAFDPNRSTQSVLWPTPGVTLTSGNTIASHFVGSSFSGVACTSTGKTTGKWYAEFVITGSSGGQIQGIADDGWINAGIGAFANSAGGGSGPSVVNGFTAANAVNRAAWANGDRGMIAFDADAGKAWIGKTNTWTNAGGAADPATGTFPWVTWTPDARNLHACFDLSQPNTGIQYVGSGFTYTPPTGYSALN